MIEKISSYLQSVATYFQDPTSSEMSYRTDFQRILEQIFPKEEKYHIQHDPKATFGNKPDFIVSKDGVPLLYLEVKKVGENLDKIEQSEQAARYFGYTNLIISDYLEFRFYRNGQKYCEPISLGKANPKNRQIDFIDPEKTDLEKAFRDFVFSQKEPIKSGKHLAKIMGGKAQRIRDNVKALLQVEASGKEELESIMKVIRENLLPDLDKNSFADMYAQTMVYGLFVARYNDSSLGDFSRREARDLVPKSNPFLQHFFDHITGPSFPKRLELIVDELCEVFAHANVKSLMGDYFRKKGFAIPFALPLSINNESPDPVIHFYEDFLLEYDPQSKAERGVFYTPLAVVRFIVRSVDQLLKDKFEIAKGLADNSKIEVETRLQERDHRTKDKLKKNWDERHRVQVLDIATGTGTFLNETIQQIHKSFKDHAGNWPDYVNEDLLPRLHGFELMMASYTIAHLKLAMTLQETGLKEFKKRLGVYLTNTLEEVADLSMQMTLFGFQKSITDESRKASEIKKDYPIMVVIGNPPYSGISQNKHYTENEAYKVEPGGKQRLQERKNWLDDDYVKFIRFAESLIEKNEEGIVGMITAHGYLDNPTFRGMRWHLRTTFDEIFVLDLHGNSNKKETAPDGGKDENVFDIKTGVAILLGVKKKAENKRKKKALAQVYQADFFGTRKEKQDWLETNDLQSIKWNRLPNDIDIWRVEGQGKKEYLKGFSVAEMFLENVTGIVTARDKLVIDKDKKVLLKRINLFCDETKTDDEIRSIFFGNKKPGKYPQGDSRGWKLGKARKEIMGLNHEKNIKSIAYRPFDTQFIYYHPKMVDWGRENIMKHFLPGDNVGLLIKRQGKRDFSYIFITNKIAESCMFESAYANNTICPLYLYSATGERVPNLNKELVEKIEKVASKTDPENILDYIYAYLHSPKYRHKFQEFLKTDFPRVPLPKSKAEFWRLAQLGERLRGLHLLTNPTVKNPITTFPIAGSNEVEKISYQPENEKSGKVFFNSEQYFGNVPQEAWNFYIGGYQPAQKFLKDRKGQKLTNADIERYEEIIVSLKETIEVMAEIDKE